MTSLGKNASGCLAWTIWHMGSGARTESLKSAVQQPRGEVPLAQSVPLSMGVVSLVLDMRM